MILTLALGIAALAVVLDLTRQVLRPAPPFPNMERSRNLVLSYGKGASHVLYKRQLEFLSAHSTSFEHLGGFSQAMCNMVVGGMPSPQSVLTCDAGLFRVLGLRPSLGRLFTAEEHARKAEDVALISYQVWQKVFAGDHFVLGRKIILSGRVREVVGVLPDGFRLPGRFNLGCDVLVPETAANDVTNNAWAPRYVLGLPKPGISASQVDAELGTLKIPGDEGLLLNGVHPVIQTRSLSEQYQVEEPEVMWAMLGAALVLHLLACVNSSTLMLVRTRDRRRELGIRTALGSSVWQLRRLLILENLALGGVALFLGACLSLWAGGAFVAYVNHWWQGPIHLQPAALLLTSLSVGIPTLIAMAVLPTLRAFAKDPAKAMKEGSGAVGQTRKTRHWLDTAVIIQATLAVVLLTGAGLMLRSVQKLREQPLGFETHNRIGVQGMHPTQNFNAHADKVLERYLLQQDSLRETLLTMPEVSGVEIAGRIPLSSEGTIRGPVQADDSPAIPFCLMDGVSPGYFGLLGISVLRGHAFEDLKPGGPRVVVINSVCAKALFGERSPLGQLIDVGDTLFWGDYSAPTPTRVKAEVIGVVPDLRSFGQKQSPMPQLFFPTWQRQTWAVNSINLVLALRQAPDAAFEERLRQHLYRFDPSITVSTLRLDEEREWMLSGERYALTLLKVLSGLALALTAVGMYSVMHYTVQCREREFGLRMALGADARQLMRSLLRRNLLIAGLAIGLGLGLAALLSRFLDSLIFNVPRIDPLTYVCVAMILLGSACLACWLPARRILGINPMQALRDE